MNFNTPSEHLPATKSVTNGFFTGHSSNTAMFFSTLLLSALFFFIIPFFGEAFYIRLFGRIMIYALAAVSLDLILGYGGMVSLGHAAYLGIGAYAAGILSMSGVENGFIVWPAAALAAAVYAAATGYVSLRTKGVYFIMITLAFAQMAFYFFSSLEQYGGDDGMALWSKNPLKIGTVGPDTSDPVQFYYLVLGILFFVLILCRFIISSPFGAVIRGSRENENRMISLGYPVFRYKWACFVFSCALAGLSGALIANQNMYISPALMAWTRSGEIMVMVILGGTGTLVGPILGAVLFLAAEEILSDITSHWMILFGPFLILVVLFAKGGVYGFLTKRFSSFKRLPEDGKNK